MTPEPVVLHVVESFAAGIARHVVDLVRHTDGFAHVIAAGSTRDEGLAGSAAFAAVEAAGARAIPIPARRSPLSYGTLRSIPAVRRLAGEVGAAIVHGHSSVGGAIARLAAPGHAICVYTPNAMAPHWLARVAEATLAPRTDCLIAVSESEGEAIRSLRFVRPNKISVVPNGIDTSPAQPADPPLRSRLGLGPDAVLVGAVARFAPQKDPMLFVGAAKMAAEEVPDAHFVLAGTGPLEGEIRRASAGAPFLHVLGGVADGPSLIAELDVFVNASRYEGGPYGPLEAMRAARAVIVSDAIGNRDTVVHGDSGLLTPVGDPRALATAIVSLVRDPARREALGAAARERQQQLFTAGEMGRRTGELYRRLLLGGRR